jgi:hypothetical protein
VVSREEMLELVRAHTELEEPMEIAREVAVGEILHGEDRGREVQEIARSVNGHAEAG